jgi:DUF917 family protein
LALRGFNEQDIGFEILFMNEFIVLLNSHIPCGRDGQLIRLCSTSTQLPNTTTEVHDWS